MSRLGGLRRLVRSAAETCVAQTPRALKDRAPYHVLGQEKLRTATARVLCAQRSGWRSHCTAVNVPQPEILPLPDGIPNEFGIYEVVGTEGTGADKDGLRTIFGVHGPHPRGDEGLERAGGGSFAVIELGNRQFKVTAGDTLYIPRIDGDVAEQIVLPNVLLVGTFLYSIFGRPLIPFASVRATVEAQTLTAKVHRTKFKKRKGYSRKIGHRQPITRLRIDSVEFDVPLAQNLEPHEIELDPKRPPLPNNMSFW